MLARAKPMIGFLSFVDRLFFIAFEPFMVETKPESGSDWFQGLKLTRLSIQSKFLGIFFTCRERLKTSNDEKDRGHEACWLHPGLSTASWVRLKIQGVAYRAPPQNYIPL